MVTCEGWASTFSRWFWISLYRVGGLIHGRGGEGFFEDGLEEIGGVSAGLIDLRFQRTAGRHQRLHPLHNRGLLGKRWERNRDVLALRDGDIVLTSRSDELNILKERAFLHERVLSHLLPNNHNGPGGGRSPRRSVASHGN